MTEGGSPNSMRFDVLTLFPTMFTGPLRESIIGRARREQRLQVGIWDIRAHSRDKHRSVDDTPYGGGPGMVMKPEPIVEAVEHVCSVVRHPRKRPRIVLLAPQGRRLTQQVVEELAADEWVMLICGHYEGIDDRVRQVLDCDEISLGDFILTGGELAAMVVIDAVARLIPGVLGGSTSQVEESFSLDGLLEYPQYTRPPEFRGLRVPDVLLSGNHGAIEQWRRRESLRLTHDRRPDLLREANLSPEDREFLAELKRRESD